MSLRIPVSRSPAEVAECISSEALTWLFLDDRQRLVWTAVLEFDAVPTPDTGA